MAKKTETVLKQDLASTFTDGGAATAAEFRAQQTDMIDSLRHVDSAVGDANVQSDWDETNTSDDAYIRNKPTIPPALTDAQIGDKAFSNPPSDLTSNEQSAVRTAIGAGTGGGGSFTPTKANIYSAVKAILDHAGNAGITADDANNELDVGAVTAGELLATLTWSNSQNAVSQTNTRFNESNYLIFEGHIDNSANIDYPFTTAVRRTDIPSAGTTFRIGFPRADSGSNTFSAALTLTSAGRLTLNPRDANSDYGTVRVWSANTPVTIATATRPETARPYISEFTISGNTDPAAGTNISSGNYAFNAAVAHADRVGAMRIIGFTGTIIPNNPTALSTILTFDHASGAFSIPGSVTLANAGDVYTIRLEVYASGQTVGTDTPITSQDRLITAHAPATANVHWGRVITSSSDTSVADTLARIRFADDDTTTGSTVQGTYTVQVPDDSNSYQSYLLINADSSLNLPTVTDFRSNGFSAFNSWNAVTTVTINSVTYNAYLLKSNFAATFTEDSNRVWTIVTS